MHLSDVFKFTHGLGQKGHQIGRKVGDAIELLVLGMIHTDNELTKYLEVEDGVEGATTAKHKVEFSFYNLENERPSKKSTDLFGIIECKKVGVEVTIKQNFKSWKTKNSGAFYETEGYSFSIKPKGNQFSWKFKIIGQNSDKTNIKVSTDKFCKNKKGKFKLIESLERPLNLEQGQKILIALDLENKVHIISSPNSLQDISSSISKCVILTATKVVEGKVDEIKVDESLPGPQTPEKAKQASFVSLDVRKKVLGQFDKKEEDKSFISVLVIGEASHWENKSRSMIRLCNDYNLIIPDKIVVYFFEKLEQTFGEGYQNKITKSVYKNEEDVRTLIASIIEENNGRVMLDMETNRFVKFKHTEENGNNRLIVEEIDNNL